MGKKGSAMRWGRKRMERKERGGREKSAEAETDRQSSSIWNGNKTERELTNEWNQTKGGEVLD